MSLVSNLIKKTKDDFGEYTEVLSSKESILSNNKVTGYSLNFPIGRTCQPSGVCINRCYFAKGGSSWSASLKKQIRLFNSTRQSPIGTGDRLITEVKRLGPKITFLRWNGGGDLFAESVEMLNYCASELPDLPFWVVTRIPQFASLVDNLANIFIHFSLDSKSLDRKEKYESLKKKSLNYFYSYQCDRLEMPSPTNLSGVSVVFFDGYKPKGDIGWLKPEVLCPLNTRTDISNTCSSCRRCFDQTAVRFRKTL